jgi:protein-S-isoprenylcysteine O-methyltransferase Ste14
MSLAREFQEQGNWLFRWRSYLPICLLGFVGLATWNAGWLSSDGEMHETWKRVCIGISLLGLAIRAHVIGYVPAQTSGRNTTEKFADTLNTTGMYSLVRHPLYLGNYIVGLGISLIQLTWWLPVIYTLAFWIYYERIMFAEEEFLRGQHGQRFEAWAAQTPAIWPRFSQWRGPELSFSLRNVLRREYTCIMMIVLAHTGVEFFDYLIKQHRLGWETFWLTFSIGGTAIYFALRHLKKKTRLLDVPGR